MVHPPKLSDEGEGRKEGLERDGQIVGLVKNDMPSVVQISYCLFFLISHFIKM